MIFAAANIQKLVSRGSLIFRRDRSAIRRNDSAGRRAGGNHFHRGPIVLCMILWCPSAPSSIEGPSVPPFIAAGFPTSVAEVQICSAMA